MTSSDKQDDSQPAVLVVDDEPEVLRLVETILTEQGYRVLVANGGDSALKVFQEKDTRPDLVLTDVVMPGMSGPMLVDQLMAIDPNIKVLFMSGYDDRQVVHRYVVSKGFQLISKPFTVKKLAGAVQSVLREKPPALESSETTA